MYRVYLRDPIKCLLDIFPTYGAAKRWVMTRRKNGFTLGLTIEEG